MSRVLYTLIESTPNVAYRTIMLGPNGEVLANEPLAARSDDEAAEMARSKATEFVIELWDGLRFIEHFEPAMAGHQQSIEPFRLTRDSFG